MCRRAARPASRRADPRPRSWSSPSSCSRRTRRRRRTAFAPLVELFGRLLDDAEAAGALRPGLDRRRITGVVLQATMFNAFAATISASPAGSGDEVLWDLLVHGITP